QETRARVPLHPGAEILEPLFAAVAALGAGKAGVGVHVDDECQVGLAGDDEVMQPVDQPAQVAPRQALIDPRRVREPVRDDDAPGCERGRDGPFQVVPAGSGEQQYLGLGRPAVGIALEHEAADLLGAGAAARLARQHDIPAKAAQRVGQKPRLCRLAEAVDPLERDEHRTVQLPTWAASRLARSVKAVVTRVRNPPRATSTSATSGTVTGVWPGMSITMSAIWSPAAIGAAT